MTLKRLMIGTGVLVLLIGIAIACLWQYGYSPQGRARNILAQFKGQRDGLRPWLMRNGLVRPVVFDMPIGGRAYLAAAELLGELGPDATPTILEWLDDADPTIRQMAVIACGITHDSRAFTPLCRCLRDKDAHVQMAAIVALGQFGPQAEKPLLQALTTCNPSARREVPESLAEACGPKAIALLKPLLQNGDNMVRKHTLHALIVADGQQCLPVLLSLLPNSNSDLRNAMSDLDDPRAFDAILPHLGESSTFVRLAARLGGTKAAPKLAELLKGPDGDIRAAAALELGKLRDKRAIPVLQEIYASDGLYSMHAAVCLADMGESKGISRLIEVLQRKTLAGEQPTWMAGELAKLGNKEGRDYLEKEFAQECRDSGASIPYAAIALTRLGDQRAFDLLLRPDINWSDNACGSIAMEIYANAAMFSYAVAAERKDARFVPIAKRLLKDQNLFARWCAGRALGKYGCKSPLTRQALVPAPGEDIDQTPWP